MSNQDVEPLTSPKHSNRIKKLSGCSCGCLQGRSCGSCERGTPRPTSPDWTRARNEPDSDFFSMAENSQSIESPAVTLSNGPALPGVAALAALFLASYGREWHREPSPINWRP